MMREGTGLMTNKVRLTRVAMAIATLALVGAAVTPGLASAGAKTSLVSRSSTGAKGNADSGEPSISKTGRYIAFNSDASNLVPGDTNGQADCFVRDQGSKRTERVSLSSGGAQANGYCFAPAISQDGRFVAFESNATNLGGSTNGVPQIYLHDRVTGSTVLVSERASGGQGGNGQSADPAISRDGQFVVYESQATDLVNNDTNDASDIFLYNRGTGNTSRVSVRSSGAQANGGSFNPAISANGKVIVFDSQAGNLVSKDTNGRRDVFIHNRVTKKSKIVSVNSKGRLGNGASRDAAINGAGRFVAFSSFATNLVKPDSNGSMDLFLHDRKTGKTTKLSVAHNGTQAAGWSGYPTISNSGRYIAFKSRAPNLVRRKDTNNEWDIFVRDRVAKRTMKISHGAGTTATGKRRQAWGGYSIAARISGDARYVAFTSGARNLIKNDNNGSDDIFRRGRLR